MPFAFDLLDEEQKKKNETQEPGQAAPTMTGGGETFGEGAQPQKQFNTGAEKGANKQGSGFVGLDKYMSANQGNGFGNQFTGKVQGTLDSAKQGLEKGSADFSQASNQGTTRWNDVESQVKGIVDGAGDTTTEDDAKKVQSYGSAKYQGPESFLGSAYGTQAQGGLTKASQQANALQTEGGRFALLDQFFGRPNYTTGEKSLDNLLVQNGKGVAARSASIGGQANQLSGKFNQTTQDMGNLVTSNRQAADETASKTKEYVTGAKSDFEKGLTSGFDEWKKKGADASSAIYDQIDDDYATPEMLEWLNGSGLSPGANIYGLDLKNYINAAPQANLGQFASDKDYARYLALAQIAGEDPTLLSKDDRANAGTAKYMPTFDQERFGKDLETDKAANSSRITQANADVSSFAPMPGEWLRSMDSRSVDQNIKDLTEQMSFYNNELARGNIHAAGYIEKLKQAIGALNSSDLSDRKLFGGHTLDTSLFRRL